MCFVFSSGFPIWTCVSPSWMRRALHPSGSECSMLNLLGARLTYLNMQVSLSAHISLSLSFLLSLSRSLSHFFFFSLSVFPAQWQPHSLYSLCSGNHTLCIIPCAVATTHSVLFPVQWQPHSLYYSLWSGNHTLTVFHVQRQPKASHQHDQVDTVMKPHRPLRALC